MTTPQIRVMIDHRDFRHLIRGGELRVRTDEGVACICFDDIGFNAMQTLLTEATLERDDRLGKIFEREAHH